MTAARALLPLLGLLLVAAAPRSSFLTATPMPSFSPPAPSAPAATAPPGFIAAPTPDQDVFAPTGPRASKDASVAPGIFSRRDQYRGEGLSPSSSAQTEQDRRAKPGAGIKFSVPLQ